MDFIIVDDYQTIPKDQWPWPNFRPAEFACRGEPGRGRIKIAIPLMDKLQALRNAMGRPMVVNSGYRTAGYNATLDGASPNSEHVQGMAADISMGNFFGDEAEVFRQARALGFTGIGFYPQHGNVFMHLDIRKPKFGGPFDWWGDPKPWGIDPIKSA